MAKIMNHSASSNRDNELDFTGLPLKETILILRRLGLRLLDDLLGQPVKPGEPLPQEHQPELRMLLPIQETRTLARSNVWSFKRTRKTGRIPGNMRYDLTRAFRRMFPRAIAGKISMKRWDIGAANRFALALGGTRGDVLPDDLWPVAAKAAWEDMSFRLTVVQRIYQWLRTGRVLAPYDFPDIHLSVNTFWVLIVLARVKPMTLTYWFSRKERADIQVERRLQQEAYGHIMANHWADFWDQWIIQLASERWPGGFKQLDNRLCKALLALPLLDTTAMTTLCRNKQSIKESFRLLAERWFEKLDGIRRLKKPVMGLRRYALINLTAPEWEHRMPPFFSALEKRQSILNTNDNEGR